MSAKCEIIGATLCSHCLREVDLLKDKEYMPCPNCETLIDHKGVAWDRTDFIECECCDTIQPKQDYVQFNNYYKCQICDTNLDVDGKRVNISRLEDDHLECPNCLEWVEKYRTCFNCGFILES